MPDPTDILEALLFASDTPLELERIREVLELVKMGRIRTQQTELFGEIVIERQVGEATPNA